MITASVEPSRKKESVHSKAARVRLRRVLRQHNEYGWLDQHELDNVKISLAWLAVQEDEESARMLITYIHELAPFLEKKNMQKDLLRWSNAAIKACDTIQENPGSLLLLRGEAQYALGLWSETEKSILAAMQMSQEQDLYIYAKAVLTLGRLQFNRGDYKKALTTLAQAEQLLKPYNDFEQIAKIRAERAAYHLNRREYDQALTLYLQLDKLYQDHHKGGPSEHTLMMLGIVYRRKKEYQQAAKYLHSLIDHAKHTNHLSSIASGSHHLAWVYLCQGNITQARHHCGEALALYQDINDMRGVADTYEQAGRISLVEGNLKEALAELQQSLSMRENLGNQHGTASSLRHIAFAHLASGQTIPAIRTMWRCLCLYKQLGILNWSRFKAILRQTLSWLAGNRNWVE